MLTPHHWSFPVGDLIAVSFFGNCGLRSFSKYEAVNQSIRQTASSSWKRQLEAEVSSGFAFWPAAVSGSSSITKSVERKFNFAVDITFRNLSEYLGRIEMPWFQFQESSKTKIS